MLECNEKVLIIDAKFYDHILQTQYNTDNIRSNHLYQIFTYVKKFAKKRVGNVAGVLLYAKTDETLTPHYRYSMGDNFIMVNDLDLSFDFITIKEKLNFIEDLFLNLF